MLNVSLVLFLFSAAAFVESVHLRELLVPPQDAESNSNLESSGDFIFHNEDHTIFYDEDTDDDNISGSGDEEPKLYEESFTTVEPAEFDNHIPEIENSLQLRPTDDDIQLVRLNKIAQPPNVHMSQAGEHSILNKTEVLAAVISGAAVGVLFAVLLILLIIYRMKKKDEGTYQLGKKPIYKKAPNTEIYA